MFSMIMGVFVIFVKETTKYNTKSFVLLSHGREPVEKENKKSKTDQVDDHRGGGIYACKPDYLMFANLYCIVYCSLIVEKENKKPETYQVGR